MMSTPVTAAGERATGDVAMSVRSSSEPGVDPAVNRNIDEQTSRQQTGRALRIAPRH
jgi:hypothetical protein